jgi:ribonucleotide monophosphatase NagD (HAD superfamily)
MQNFNEYILDFRSSFLLNISMFNLYLCDVYIIAYNGLRNEIPILNFRLYNNIENYNIANIYIGMSSNLNFKTKQIAICTEISSFLLGKTIFSKQ